MKPFEVWNPFSGRWFVFHWWTDHDRGHLAFASTEDGLLDVATNVFQKEPYAECKGVLEIEVVAPSDLMSQIANKHDLEEEVMHFSYEIFGQLAYARDAGKTLPSMFVTCPKYQPEEDVTDDDWAREKHYGCQNCMNGISLVGMTKVELHARFYDDWEKTKEDRTRHRRSDPPQLKRAPSTAPKASDDDTLWYARANFGHHAGGVELHEVDLAESDAHRPGCLTKDTLFFYRRIREIGTGEKLADAIGTMSAAFRRVSEEESERRDNLRRQEREREQEERDNAIIDFFNQRETTT